MDGSARERQVRRHLEEQGWWVARAAGSFGDADLVASRANGMRTTVWLIEVKANKDGGPYKTFGPSSRAELSAAAVKAGAKAWLCYWPARAPMRWIEESAWPSA